MMFSRIRTRKSNFGRYSFLLALTCVGLGPGCGGASTGTPPQVVPDPSDDVAAVERAFAASMAQRDLKAFATFLSDEALFVSDGRTLRGKEQILDTWKRFFEGSVAPFSWEPARVEKIDSGLWALSTGPVRDRHGAVVATFTSIWRKEAQGWRIVFDRGVDVAECPSAQMSIPPVAWEKPQFGAHNEFRRQAREAYKRKDFAGFLTLTQWSDAAYPQTPAATYNIACGHALVGQTKEALADLEKLLQMNVFFDVTRDEDLASLQKLPAFGAIRDNFAALEKKVIGTSTVAFTLPERQFVPEGIAYDAQTKSFFVSSVHQRKIVRISADGKSKDFAASNLHAVLGMAMDEKRRTLWACSTAVPEMKDYTFQDKGLVKLVAFDVDSGKQRRVVGFDDTRMHMCNDLAVDGEGRLFVSDPSGSTVYTLAPGAGTLEVFLGGGAFTNPQGIALHPEGKSFYVADYSRGIAHVDRATRDVTWLVAPPNATFLGIDGLLMYAGGLIAIQNGIRPHRVFRLVLEPSGKAVQSAEILEMNHPAFNEPTLGVVVGKELFYVANSQWGSFDKGVIWPAEKMKEPVILKRLLD